MEKMATVDEDDNIDNDEERVGEKGKKRSAVSAYQPRNIRKRKSKSCRRRNILQRDESIRKEVVRGNFFILLKYNFSPFLLLQFVKIGRIAGDSTCNDWVLVSCNTRGRCLLYFGMPYQLLTL